MREEKTRYELLREVKLVGEDLLPIEETWDCLWREIQRRKTRRLFVGIMQAAAVVAIVACVALLSTETPKTTDGETLAVNLPCGSTVELADNSSARYNRIAWMFSRQLKLSGNATFDVSKGRKFTVKTEQGTITVLGTQFRVDQSQETFKVICYEGSVRVAAHNESVVLNKGEQVIYDSSSGLSLSNVEEILPEYIEYSNAKLSDVANKIEDIFGLKIENIELCDGLMYTGFLSTRDRIEAMDIVFGACELTYIINNTEVVLIK